MTDLVLAQGNQLDDPWRHLRRISTRRQLEMLGEAPVRDNLAAMETAVLELMPAVVRAVRKSLAMVVFFFSHAGRLGGGFKPHP